MRSQNHLRWYLKCKFCRLTFRLIIILFFCLGISQTSVSGQTPKQFKVGTIVAEPGTKVSGLLEVPEGIDQGTIIPVTIVNGNKPGPVLTLIAGIHGTEYVPIITLQKILLVLDPNEISGTVIMIQIANVPSFKGREVYYDPVDHKNLNREFPGNKEGTLTERMAEIITREVIYQSDYLIDLHGGELNQNELSYLYFYFDCPDKTLCERSELLAHAFGAKYMEPVPYNFLPDSSKSTYSDLTAMRKGIPVIMVEAGDRGIVENNPILFMEQGITNVMKAIKMTKGEFKESNPIGYLTNEVGVYNDFDGILYSNVNCGQTVSKGELLGYITDYFGNKIEEFHSPITGIILVSLDSPVANKGEPVFAISELKETYK
jgi:predicted deacylase